MQEPNSAQLTLESLSKFSAIPTGAHVRFSLSTFRLLRKALATEPFLAPSHAQPAEVDGGCGIPSKKWLRSAVVSQMRTKGQVSHFSLLPGISEPFCVTAAFSICCFQRSQGILLLSSLEWCFSHHHLTFLFFFYSAYIPQSLILYEDSYYRVCPSFPPIFHPSHATT